MSEENKKTKEEEIVTIQDFKSILVGMDLILGDNWTPDENQWKRIRTKIDALIKTAEQPAGTRRYNIPNVVPNTNVSENELIRTFPSVPAAENVPIGQQPMESALTPIPTTPASPSVSADEKRVHRTDEFI